MGVEEMSRSSESTSAERQGDGMAVLRIEHPVPDYGLWKRAFDADPVGRERSGVRRYQVMRAVDDPNYVLIDLEFDSPGEAQALLDKMRVVWERVAGSVVSDPKARIVERAVTREY
jgi:ribosomal protein L35AE/L33A